MSDSCENLLLVQAEFDGELDAAQSAALVAHRAQCPVCRKAAAKLQQLRTEIRRHAMVGRSATNLRAQLLQLRRRLAADRALGTMCNERGRLCGIELAVKLGLDQKKIFAAIAHRSSSPFAISDRSRRARQSRDITVPIGVSVIWDISL